jgi:hypothetical protein
MQDTTEIAIRPSRHSDEAFIYATWLRQLWYSHDTITTLNKDVFMRVNHNLIEKTLKEDPILVACLADDKDTIVGYCAFKDEPYVYLKKAWRGLGIEELLLNAMATY